MKVAILGADGLGRDIAHRCAVSGDEVHLHAEDASGVMDSIDIIERRLDDAVAAGSMESGDQLDALDRLEATTGLEAAVADADIVIDTVTDEVGALQKRFASIEGFAETETLIVTSHPTLSVTAATAGLRHPDRALGLECHGILEDPIVEVVISEQTDESAVATAETFVRGFEGTPVRVRDSPGLASGRLALALEVEAMRLVADGIAGVDAVDQLMVDAYGHDCGPLEHADRAGLNDRLDLLESLTDSLGERYRPPELLEDMVLAGQTGADASEGFYVWESGEPTEPAIDSPDYFSARELPDDPGLE